MVKGPLMVMDPDGIRTLCGETWAASHGERDYVGLVITFLIWDTDGSRPQPRALVAAGYARRWLDGGSV